MRTYLRKRTPNSISLESIRTKSHDRRKKVVAPSNRVVFAHEEL